MHLIRCEDFIAGCISPNVYIDGIDCCNQFFPKGSFVSPTGACVTTFSAPPIIQVGYISSIYNCIKLNFKFFFNLADPVCWIRICSPCQGFTRLQRYEVDFLNFPTFWPMNYLIFLNLHLALDNSIINPIMANQKGVTFTATDKWTDPTVALFKERHYTRIGLWTSVAISRTTVGHFLF